MGRPIENVIPEFGSAPDLTSFLEAPEAFDGARDSMAARKDGGWIPIELGLSSVGDPGDLSIIVTVTDISERKRLEEHQKLQNTALKHSNEELEQFAFVASHDLREPLRKLLSFSQLLLSGRYGNFNERGHEFVGYMRDAVQRMEALLDSLLSYSRVTSKGRPFESVDLNEVIRDVETDLQITLEESNGTLTISPLPAVLGDKVQLHQLFQNLISNSLKYRKANEPPQIRIYSQQGEIGYVDLYVADSGIGFDMQYKGQIFEVFKRLHGRTEYDGTGMGLAICRKIVDRHRGMIDVESEEGVGTTFRISLKVA
jgi:light-regulated signal transduction histidine kinase (bacteriophytochrome)